MKTKLSAIFKACSELKTSEEKVTYLRNNDNGAVRTVLNYAFNPNIKFLLPKGPAPYKPFEGHDAEGRLYSELRRLYLFVEGGNPNLNNVKREHLFIQLLESVDREDAELLVSVKDKKMPYKGITLALIKKAFPDLLPEEKDEQVK